MTPKTWREVELWQEYLRGFVAGLRVQWAKVEEDTSEALDELASLEALKPCGECGGAGGMVEYGSFFPARRGGCSGTGIAPKKEKDRE